VAHNNLAMMLIRRDTPDAALPHARQAVQIAPRRAAFQDTHALALMGAGQPAQAVEAARKAASLERGRPEFYVTLGQALVEADRLEEARDLLDRLDRAIRPEMNLPADLARRLDALRRKLGAGDPAGAAAGAAGAAVPDR
jgi:predicted Zn-dependent protease